MILPHDYAIEINADEVGVFIIVRHKITGSQREARPLPTESVGAVRDRLVAQIEAEIYDPDEFMFTVGHGREDDKVHDFVQVVHKPTGIERLRWSFESDSRLSSHRELLDEVLTELWFLRE